MRRCQCLSSMLSEFEADTAEYIMAKFAMIYILIRERKYGYSVVGKLKGADPKLLWIRYRHIVIETRIRMPGALICGQVDKTREGYQLVVEIY